VHALEKAKQVVGAGAVKACAVVLNADAGAMHNGGRRGVDVDDGLRSIAGEFAGVVQHLYQQLVQQCAVGPYAGQVGGNVPLDGGAVCCPFFGQRRKTRNVRAGRVYGGVERHGLWAQGGTGDVGKGLQAFQHAAHVLRGLGQGGQPFQRFGHLGRIGLQRFAYQRYIGGDMTHGSAHIVGNAV